MLRFVTIAVFCGNDIYVFPWSNRKTVLQGAGITLGRDIERFSHLLGQNLIEISQMGEQISLKIV
jgi:hypothetical protein